MKRMFLVAACLFLIHLVNGQLRIVIDAKKQHPDAKVEAASTLSPDKNEIVIESEFDDNTITVFIENINIPFNFQFGKGGGLPLKKGKNVFLFSNTGTVANYPGASQQLQFPAAVKILDNNNQSILERNIDFSIQIDNPNKDIVKTEEDVVQKAGLTKIPIYDALLLADYKKLGRTQYVEILNHYLFSETILTKDDDLIAAYASNKFLADAISNALNDMSWDPLHKSSPGLLELFGSAVSSVGGLDVTNIADGFAKFLVKRTKEELNIAFFEKFKEYISKYDDLRTVFPQTYRALMIIGDEIYNYERYIQTLRESFENDLSTLEENLPTIIDNHPDFFEKHPWLAAMLNSGCYIASGLEDKIHPGDILKDYPVEFLDALHTNWKGAIQTLQLVSTSLRDTSVNTDSIYWVKVKQVRDLVGNKLAFKIYLGLLYQQAKENYDGIKFQVGDINTTLVDQLDNVSTKYDIVYTSYSGFIRRFAEKANKLNEMIKNYAKPANDSLAFEQYYKYFNSSVDLLQHCTEISKLPFLDKVVPHLADTLKPFFDVTYAAADLVLDIRRRNYSSAITNAVEIYTVVMDLRSRREVVSISARKEKRLQKKVNKDVTDFIVKKSAEDKSFVFTATQVDSMKTKRMADVKPATVEKTSFSTNDTVKKLYKYGTFMATMVQAKNSDEVQKAIEAFALPTGSSRIKRVSGFNVSLNAYPGLYIGNELIRDVDEFKPFSRFNSYGVTATIGIGVNWGHRLFFVPTKAEWSTSLYLSLVDIGAVAAFRFKDDTTAQVPSIQLKHIFSPGAFLSIGIPKTPLSVNLGTQMGPNLRKVNNNPDEPSNDFANKIYWRFSASICVDIPILNFYTKSR